VAGRIREDDIAEVREKARIDDVVSEYVTLRRAGGGSFKGLCPFHDEKSPSFHVTPARSVWHCFGCGEGGDVIAFVQKIDGLTFTETVERLADKYGVQLRREDAEPGQSRPQGPPRRRLVEAHKLAQAFYAEQLGSADALVARQFLHQRGFDQAAAEQFGVGFSPRDGDALLRHLRASGFSQDELVTAGLVGTSRYDRFRGRLMWPIRDATGDTIGFGARRLFDDDRIDAKYLNTSETPIYKKSQVLYGLDLARREIARSSRAVLVEGYTDVMACHLAGVGTAVATCGTAFGDEHARVLRRFLNDHEESRGEVIFTFDGDAAGQKAALRAFAGDQNFVSQTYVAIEPTGLDPCDLRIEQGDAAVRELVARRVPLYRFVLANTVQRYDLDRADGRIDALREGARLVASVRDRAKVDAFARELAQLIGVDIEEARAEVRRAERRGPRPSSVASGRAAEPAEEQPKPRAAYPSRSDPRFSIERETLKLLVQFPTSVGGVIRDVGSNDFVHPIYRAVWDVIAALGGISAGVDDPQWAAHLLAKAPAPEVAAAISALSVESVLREQEPDPAYVAQHVYRLQELTVQRRIAEVKSKLQRTNPVEHQADYNRMFGELIALEQRRHSLREQVVGQQ
jgi:DNA primase